MTVGEDLRNRSGSLHCVLNHPSSIVGTAMGPSHAPARHLMAPLLKLTTCFVALLFPSVSSASSPPAGCPHFQEPFDHEQWRRDHPLPAAKLAADLNAGEPRTVRMIYFLPNDRQVLPDIDAKLDELIDDVQQSYAEQMENHGFGRRTFRFETDADGKAVVHHVKGEFADSHYHSGTFGKVWKEMIERFDPARNIYLVTLDVSNAVIDGYCGQGADVGSEGGMVLIPAPNGALQLERGWSCFSVSVAAHELGHGFALWHVDSRNAIWSPSSYHTDRMVRSFCAAEWLDAHRYFNSDHSYPETDRKGTIRMLPPMAVPPNALRLRFEVTDPDGLHQTQLRTSVSDGVVGCQAISGKRATVEFVTHLALEDAVLRILDVNGNVTYQEFPIDIAALLSPEIVSIPDANLAAVVKETLGLPPEDTITQLYMLRLRQLQASFREITDLTGLEHAVNLTHLWLRGNQIRDITPLAGLTLLVWLELISNSISDLSPLEQMKGLEYLWLSDNSVSELSPLAGLTILKAITLAGNPIAEKGPLHGLARRNPFLEIDLDTRTLGMISGDGQEGAAGAALDEPFAVFMLDRYGDPLARTEVTFAVTGGGGSLSVATAITDDDGRASTTLTLGSQPGTNTVEATVDGLEPVTFTATGVAIPRTLAKLSGDEQQAAAGAVLAEPFLVSVRDQSGAAFPGAVVTFAVLGDGGTLSTASDTTDAEGLAATTLTLGRTPGTNTVRVAVAGLEPVTFTATGLAVPRTLVKLSGDDQQAAAGAVLVEPFVVEVRDQNGDPLAGVQVTFAVTAGGGTLSATTATTDADGRAAATLTLGREPGTNTVEATVAGLDPVTFTATGQATADFDGDGETGFSDFFLFADAFGGSDPRFDLDGSGSVDFADFFLLADHFADPEARGKLLALAREMIGLPDGPQLRQNAPNPFNSETVISWFQLRPGPARVEVFALTGQRVAVLHEGPKKAGIHRLRWAVRGDRGRPLASGVYVYRLVTAEAAETRKLTLLR